jgi:homopolymeric O-antigen transport system ATP-binding protein
MLTREASRIGDPDFDFPMASTALEITPARPPAISVRSVSKTYKLYARPVDRLYELFSGQRRHTERHSLRNVSFDVQHGEVVGIIGANGAGKSTLLRIIASRLEPTSGSIAVDGSVVAILELGTGFHPEFTGRENVYLGGLCLGLTREQIRAEMENIIAFSELEEVIDTPFRTYSTGMQARLTFATAVAVNPDILIIDEALSVGDNRFQLKSFNKIRSFKEAGKTILLVTHSMSAVATFCDRAVLLHKGAVIVDGEPNWVTNVYHNLQFGDLAIERALAQRPSTRSAPNSAVVAQRDEAGSIAGADLVPIEELDATHTPQPQSASVTSALQPERQAAATGDRGDEQPPDPSFVLASPDVLPSFDVNIEEIDRGVSQGYRYGTRRALIAKVVILDDKGQGPVVQLISGEVYQFVMDCEVFEPFDELFVGFLVRDSRGEILFGIDSRVSAPPDHHLLKNVQPGQRCRIVLKVRNWLGNGTYFVTGALADGFETKADMWFDAFEFHVIGTENTHTYTRVNLQPEFKLFALDPKRADEVHE